MKYHISFIALVISLGSSSAYAASTVLGTTVTTSTATISSTAAASAITEDGGSAVEVATAPSNLETWVGSYQPDSFASVVPRKVLFRPTVSGGIGGHGSSTTTTNTTGSGGTTTTAE